MGDDKDIIPNITTNEDFQKLADGAVAVLHFWAPWAEACTQMNSVMSELAKDKDYPNFNFLKVEAESVPEISLRYKIVAVPTFIFIKNFQQFDRIDGAHAAELTKKVRHYHANPQSIVISDTPKAVAAATDGRPQEETKEALHQRLKSLIHSHPCMVFMKGNADEPRCGFSKQLVSLLNEKNADYKTFDILSDESVRQGLKEYSNWPTYPQLYINGELIGGLDIVKELIESGELLDKLSKKSSFDEKLKALINKAPIMVFMKGSSEEPRCGFSRTLVQMLNETGAKYETFDILQDEEVRQGLKTYSNWPTYPQVYVKGQLIGGLDIIKFLRYDKCDPTLLGDMALIEDYEVNQKLLHLLQDGGKGSLNIVSVINSAFANAPDAVLIKLIVDLRALIPLLDQWRQEAVQSILAVDWSAKSDEVVREHSQLLVSIATAHACHLNNVLRFFVKKFLGSPQTSESLEEHDAQTSAVDDRSWNEAHKCLALILEILPTCGRTLIKILRETFPYMKRPVAQLRNYSKNLLTVTTYAPNLRVDILRIVVDELIKLDTTCSQEALEAAVNDSITSSSDGEVFQMEADDSHGQKAHLKEIIDTRTKLDVCMCDIFKYLSSLRNEEQEEKASSLYTDLLTIFESSVLPVYSSHHVQFLWFVFCSYDKKFWKHFLNWLWLCVQTPSTASSVRQNAASYLASYLARATYLNISMVTAYVQAWVNWIHAYIGSQEGAGGKENVSVHSTFYSLCQAVFYVVVFRVKEILALRNGHDFLKSLNLDRVVTCRLNPLKYCSEKVVINFANVSRNYQFAFCYTVLERNRRSSFYEQRCTGIAPHQLVECFFPFDPYLLPKSIEFVTPLYREYDEGHLEAEASHVSVTPRRGDEDDVDDFLDGELMETSPRRAVGSFGMMSSTAQEPKDMFSYSISPGFKHG